MKKKLLYSLSFLLTTLLLLEIAVRIWGYSAHYMYDPIYAPFPASVEIPFVHKPNLVNRRARGLAIINTDSLGLRSLQSGTVYAPKQPHEYRIAIMGDSVTFGEGIPQTVDTYPQRLQDQLNRQLPDVHVSVFNFGVSAYSVQTMAATLQHRALAIQPDLVLMAVAPQDFDLRRTGFLDQWGYNVSQDSGSSWLKHILRQSHLIYVLRDFTLPWRSAAPPPDTTWQLPDSYHYLRDFAAIAQEHNIPYAIVLLPTWPPDTMAPLPAQLLADELVFVNLLSLSHDLSLEKYRATQFDGHPSVLVHERIATALVDYVSMVMGE